MRENIAQQLAFVAPGIDHRHAAELERMDELLNGLSGAARRVADDLREGVQHQDKGRRGLSGEQVLRIVVLKQLTSFSYAQLAFHLADSMTYRRFCRLGWDGWWPKASTLQANVKRVRPQTLEWIHGRLMQLAVGLQVEDGRSVRVDSTVVESDIHHPNDSSLLFDGVRVLSRLLKESHRFVDVVFSDHTRRAKRRALKISNAKTMKKRVPLYQDLLKVTRKTLGYVREAIRLLARHRRPAPRALYAELNHYAALVSRVFEQTQRRVVGGESVPATEKVVSIFESHTDILVKGGRETQYGHKIFVSTGRSGLILNLTVERGNPPDSGHTVPIITRHAKQFGAVPVEAAFDAGFASMANQDALMDLGVKECAFPKNSKIDVMRSVSSPAVHRRLQRFRAGIEASISWVKRCFGLSRCTWSGFESFQAYAWASVIAANLLQLARHTMT